MKRFLLLLCFFIWLIDLQLYAKVFYVKPGTASTAWASMPSAQVYSDLPIALSAAVKGDEVWVSAGTYKPTTGTDRAISFSIPNGVKVLGGFAGTETSASARSWNKNKTILSGDIGAVGDTSDNCYHVVRADAYVRDSTFFSGFIIQDGTQYGGGMYLHQASMQISYCIFRNNWGSGVCCSESSPVFSNCFFIKNHTTQYGGVCFIPLCNSRGPKFINCVLWGNTAGRNSVASIWTGHPENLVFNNCIIWNNKSTNKTNSLDGSVSYNCIEGGYQGIGNFSSDPLFVDTTNLDFRLKQTSPCINTGNNLAVPIWTNFDFNGETRIKGGTVDMGVFERDIEWPLPLSPKNDEVLKGMQKGDTVTFVSGWKSTPPTDIVGYVLKYWERGKNPNIIKLNDNKYTTILSAGKYYYWQVASIKANNDTLWSATSSFSLSHVGPIYVKTGASGDGSSWSSAFGSLQDALYASTYGDEIWISAGTYYPTTGTDRSQKFNLLNGVKLLGGFSGIETNSEARNWNLNKTILSGNIGNRASDDDNSYQVLNIKGSLIKPIDNTTLVDGLIIEKANGGIIDNRFGGGFSVSYASPVIKNCIIRNNVCYGGGGGFIGGGYTRIENCLITGNTANYGGGLEFACDSAIIINSTITQNYKTGSDIDYTAGVFAFYGTLKIVNSIIWKNSNNYFRNNSTLENSCIENENEIYYKAINVIHQNPLFVNASKGDFHLKPNSPCIDKGEIDVYSDIKYDIDKNLRLMGSMVDIGVYEMPKPKAIFPQDKSGAFSNKIIDYQWALNKYGNINASHNFMIKAWEKGNESIPVDKSSLNTYDFASLYSYQPRKAYQWIVGTVVDSFTYWSDTTTFYVGHNHPLYVKSGSNGDGTSWASAYGELIDALNASYPGDQVWVAAGTYKPATVTDRNASFKLKSAVALYGGFNGTESFEEYRNPKANLTILSGDIGISGDASDNSYHVFCDTVSLAEDSIVGALVDGFTITGGNSDAGNGAAMLNLYASPEVYNCIFTNNHAANGAAIYNSKASSPYIYNSLFYGNTAGTAGGAICSDATSKPVVISSTITNNTAATGGGISGGGTIGNTIIFGNSTGEIDGQPAVTYSCVKGGFSGAGNVKGNPGFIDVGRNNYRLSGFSSCYNKGSNALLPFGYLSDLDYVHSRILQGVVDIGAYELEKPDTIKIDSITPAQNSTYKNIYGPVVVYFNQSVQRMNLGKIQITPAVNLKSTSLNADSTQLTLNYKTPWSFDQDYKLAIAANSVAYAGNNLIGTRDTSFKFRIRSCIPALIILDKTATLFCPNVSTTLKVDTVKGDGNSDFKWYYGLNLLSKFNGLNKMNIDSISDNTLGLYKCEISDMCGLQTEDSIRLGYKANITYPEIVKKWNDILLVKNPDGLFSNYVWKYGGSDLGKNVQYITYNRFGTYDVWATDAGSGCTVHGQYVVNSKKSASIKIYPNPIHVSDIVTIDFGEQKSGTIRLFDMKGVLVYSGEFNTDVQYRFNNTNLMPGVYLLEIVSDGERTVNKLVINK